MTSLARGVGFSFAMKTVPPMTNNSATEAAAGKADIVERLEKAAADFEGMRGWHANAEDGDCEPHYSTQLEMADASKAALEAATEIASLRERVKELEEECRECKQLAADNFKRAKSAEARAETAERERDAANRSEQLTFDISARLLRERDAAREALGIAMSHIEHMSAWITNRRDPTKLSAYSFESLGEDMPQIRAARAITGEK